AASASVRPTQPRQAKPPTSWREHALLTHLRLGSYSAGAASAADHARASGGSPPASAHPVGSAPCARVAAQRGAPPPCAHVGARRGPPANRVTPVRAPH